MTNTLITPKIIAKEALMALNSNAVMSNLVHRDYSEEFVHVGDTITIRKPATFTANEFGGSIEVQDAKETGVPVKMDKLLDVSFTVTTKERSLDIEDFSQQFIKPAAEALVQKMDALLIGLEASCTNRVNHAEGPIALKDILDARKMLNSKKAPLTDRSLVFGTDAEAELLANELFLAADKVGDEGTALREASLGRKLGFNCYLDQNIAKVSSYTPSLAFNKNAFALVTRTPDLPTGAASAYIENYNGFGIRVVEDYDIKTKSETISLDMLCGVAILDQSLAAIIADSRA